MEQGGSQQKEGRVFEVLPLENSFPNSKVSLKTLKKNSSLFLIISFTFSVLKFVRYLKIENVLWLFLDFD